MVLAVQATRQLNRGLTRHYRLEDLQAWRVSVIALNGLAFDLSTAAGRMMATVIAGVAQFERELIQERIKSGMAAARARGRKLGRQPGQRPKSDRLAAKMIRMVEEEKLSYRIVAKRLDLSKNTVLEIIKRHLRADTGQAER